MTLNEQNARIAYEAYVTAVGGTAGNGFKLPAFSELGERQQQGWVAAAASLLERASRLGGIR